MSSQGCLGARGGPDDGQGGYRARPSCLIEATATLVCFDIEDDTAPTA